MEPWILDAIKISSAILGILILAFGFLYLLVCVPWKRCRRACKPDVEIPTSVADSQRVPPPPYYSLISELLTVPSANSPPLPTYAECTPETLPPRFEEQVGPDEQEAVPPYTPPYQEPVHSSRFSVLHFGRARRTSAVDQPQRGSCCSDMCIRCSIPQSPPSNRPPPSYTISCLPELSATVRP